MPHLQPLISLAPHPQTAWQISFNPVRNLLATCSADKTFRIYSFTLPPTTSLSPSSTDDSTPPSQYSGFLDNASDPKPTFRLDTTVTTKHKKSIRSIAWTKDGNGLATGSFDSTVGIWAEVIPDRHDHDHDHDHGEGNEGVERYGHGDGDEDPVQDGEAEGEAEWECVTTLEGHESECKSVAFSSDGGLLGSCSRDKSVWVWEVQPDDDFECIAVMMEHSQDVKCIAWHPHEEILASASYDSHIHLHYDDPNSDWTVFQKLHPKLPPAPLVIPTPTSLSSASTSTTKPTSQTSNNHPPNPNPGPSSRLIQNMTPTSEELEAESRLDIPPLEEDETVWSLAWSPCGGYLASGGDLGGVRIWTRGGTNTDSPLTETLHTTAHSRSVFSLSWSPGGLPVDKGGKGLLASAGGDGKIIVWQVYVDPPISGETETNMAKEDGKDTEGGGQVKLRPIAAMRDAHGVADVNSVDWLVRDDGMGKGRGVLGSCGDDGSVRVWRLCVED